jgi:hypothetical protein
MFANRYASVDHAVLAIMQRWLYATSPAPSP